MTFPKKAYFVGIGGIGMSALAQYLKHNGVAVSGSDRETSPVTELLAQKGIAVIVGQRAENVPPDADVVVYSEAVWEDNAERARAAELGIAQISYFNLLGKISAGKRTLAVSGTHGKTTTTGMIARILRDAGLSPTAIVGSLVRDFDPHCSAEAAGGTGAQSAPVLGNNYLAGESDMFVVEACEYKRDFLSLAPLALVITNLEWDHTDYYRDLADLQSAFRQLMEKIPRDGTIVTDAAHPNIAPLLGGLSARVVDYRGEPSYEIRLPGEFNRMNARAAAAAARAIAPSLTDVAITDSLCAFQGTWRRFEFKGKTPRGAQVYDDYAHHPTAVAVTLAELRKKTKGKIFVAFHPHLYSRTRDLLDGFAHAFANADEVVIAPIYAARENDDGSVSNRILAERIAAAGVPAAAIDSFSEITAYLDGRAGPDDAVITMGAGDIYKVADALVTS